MSLLLIESENTFLTQHTHSADGTHSPFGWKKGIQISTSICTHQHLTMTPEPWGPYFMGPFFIHIYLLSLLPQAPGNTPSRTRRHRTVPPPSGGNQGSRAVPPKTRNLAPVRWASRFHGDPVRPQTLWGHMTAAGSWRCCRGLGGSDPRRGRGFRPGRPGALSRARGSPWSRVMATVGLFAIGQDRSSRMSIGPRGWGCSAASGLTCPHLGM